MIAVLLLSTLGAGFGLLVVYMSLSVFWLAFGFRAELDGDFLAGVMDGFGGGFFFVTSPLIGLFFFVDIDEFRPSRISRQVGSLGQVLMMGFFLGSCSASWVG